MPASVLHYDPYDLWAVEPIGRMKLRALAGDRLAYAGCAVVALADAAAPVLMRKLLRVRRRSFPHVLAVKALTSGTDSAFRLALDAAESGKSRSAHGWGWGYSFDWYTRQAPDGVYRAGTQGFVTVTPYVMMCLARLLGREDELGQRARALFSGTLGFLDDLVPLEETAGTLCISYAPQGTGVKIVNASSYAAYAYALHLTHPFVVCDMQAVSKKVHRLVAFVLSQQEADGRWYYLARGSDGNFLDTFHSCFVVRNLLATARMLPGLQSAAAAAERGFAFIREHLYDDQAGLCRRFLGGGMKDPLYRWDLYDQAEYLGLLVDFGRLSEATRFVAGVERVFRRGMQWYCRVDRFGRVWGAGFERWGIASFAFHQSRLQRLLQSEPRSCAA